MLLRLALFAAKKASRSANNGHCSTYPQHRTATGLADCNCGLAAKRRKRRKKSDPSHQNAPRIILWVAQGNDSGVTGRPAGEQSVGALSFQAIKFNLSTVEWSLSVALRLLDIACRDEADSSRNPLLRIGQLESAKSG